jgi:hypothetical protein
VKFGGVGLEGAVGVEGDAKKFNGFRIWNNFIVDFKRMSDGVMMTVGTLVITEDVVSFKEWTEAISEDDFKEFEVMLIGR